MSKLTFALGFVALFFSTGVAFGQEQKTLRSYPQTCKYTDGPARAACGADSANVCGTDWGLGRRSWHKSMQLIPWSPYHQGEYAGPARLPHLGEYRVRVDDQIDFVYRLTRERSSKPYELAVGDQVRARQRLCGRVSSLGPAVVVSEFLGEWISVGGKEEAEILAVHAALLHTGKIVFNSGDRHWRYRGCHHRPNPGGCRPP